jgi:hypothetical protein
MGLLTCVQVGFGQALTNNNALITITPATRITLMGGALNNGDLTNNGTLSITGDWMNADTYTPGSGLLIFDGSSSQNIAHNGGQVYRLRFDGNGEKTVSGTLEVQDTLELINGHVNTNGAMLMVQSNGTVIGGSEISYVDGPLYHQGTGYKYYPVGNDGNFRPAELLNVTGTNPVLGISVNEPNTNPVIPLQLLAVSDTRYWQLIQQSGIYGGSQIRVKVGPDERLGSSVDLADVVVAASDSIGGMFLSLGQTMFSGTLQDGEVTSSLPAVNEFYAIAVEGFAEERALYVPNALSPAAPNPEDQVIKVYGQQILDEDFIFRIYNRWGQLVYETKSFTEANAVGWAGEHAGGEEESVGVYHYTLTGKFTSGRIFNRQGTITVIR